ncbi:Cupin RmlC-type [Macrophomina phaseolina MS6]|uniref:Cupin RmlC-type n=1 Tax=Macrophomina phaseolina (strain MS6) TaxID=1126212 RepID=K2RJX3_MACPH|nr:Cupin RmlC-type [Macrophomina phaseolina MS6]
MANLPRAPNRQFAFHGFMRPWLGIYAKLVAGGKKPPTHFHVHQTEFFRVLKGNLSVDINGRRVDLSPADGEYTVPPFTHHVIYGTPGTEHNEVEFEVSAEEKRDGAYAMDQPFFENWYGYQEDVFQRGVKLDFIQVLAVRRGRRPTPPDMADFAVRCSTPVTRTCRRPHGCRSAPS